MGAQTGRCGVQGPTTSGSPLPQDPELRGWEGARPLLVAAAQGFGGPVLKAQACSLGEPLGSETSGEGRPCGLARGLGPLGREGVRVDQEGKEQGSQKRLRLVLINSPCTSGSNFDLLLCKCDQPGKGPARASCHHIRRPGIVCLPPAPPGLGDPWVSIISCVC